MTELDLDALCERVDINEDEANDALRTVRLLCAAPPHGIMLSEQDVSRVLWAAAGLYAALPDVDGVPGGFYRFVEDVVTVMKQSRLKNRPRVAANPMRA